MSESKATPIYDRAGRGIQIAANSALIHQCNCINVSTFNGTHDEFCAIAHLAHDIDSTLAERDTELATTHQALAQCEAGAAELRLAIQRYLADVELGEWVLRKALTATDAGETVESELLALRAKDAEQTKQIAALQVQLGNAGQFEQYWQERNHAAWELVGGLSYGLQYQIGAAKTLPTATNLEKTRALASPYVDPRAYFARLDKICGPENWSQTLTLTDRGCVCALTIFGVTKSAAGDYPLGRDDENPATSAEMQAFKRACAAFGLGRYLYSLPQIWGDYDGDKKQILNPVGIVAQMYASLPGESGEAGR